ncbi:MAG: hypothetical protein RLZZ63_1061, partial [Gemmatimonadota bacterium]
MTVRSVLARGVGSLGLLLGMAADVLEAQARPTPRTSTVPPSAQQTAERIRQEQLELERVRQER